LEVKGQHLKNDVGLLLFDIHKPADKEANIQVSRDSSSSSGRVSRSLKTEFL
jgi:hypothetical protein